MAVICMIGMYVDYAVWKEGYMEEDCMEDIIGRNLMGTQYTWDFSGFIFDPLL